MIPLFGREGDCRSLCLDWMVCGVCLDMSLFLRIGPYGAEFDPNGNNAGDSIQPMKGSLGDLGQVY